MTNCEHLIENALVAIRCGDVILKSRLIKKPTALAVGSSHISKFNEGRS
jgi:hypothetical protein